MRLHLIACEVFQRELMQAAAASVHQVDVAFLPKDLHDRGGKAMAAEIQQRIDAVPAGPDAVLLGWALCNNGLIGLHARHAPLVAYRAHDCIACLLGSRQRYEQEFKAVPGTYWQSAGWMERSKADGGRVLSGSGAPDPADPRWLALVERYGEDNAQFLWDELREQASHYQRLAYVDTGIGPQAALRAEAARRAAERGWRFEAMTGDPAWIAALVGGAWDAERFLVVPPGQRVEARYDGSLAAAVPAA
ncbi:MAG: DUF1638 domain-containing protein [Planctomycetes bacterium]|nr:DUF1638 domain-containing protein [Planctomycetota bacterium]